MSIPTFPTLFKLSNDKIYEWSIKVQHKNDDIYTILTSHGDKDGKKVIHEKDYEEGKAKRTSLEQAILEATKKWKNKTEKELYSEEVSMTSDATSSKIIVRPMLANKFSFALYSKNSRAFKIPFPAYVQKKYDGIRCISYMRSNEVILESRKGIHFQHFSMLKDMLKPIFQKLPANFYLDGELYTDKLDFQVFSGLIRLTEGKSTSENIENINQIEYHIYDFIDLDRPLLTYKERLDILKKIKLNNNLCILADTFIANKLEDVKTFHDKFIQEGYEGAMIRDIDGIYEVNKRSKYLQKYKEFMEEEFKVVGYEQGTGDEKGAIVWRCITKDNKPFSVRPKGTFESRKKLYEEGDKYIGKDLTVIFQEYTTEGIPRFPVGKGIRDIY